MDNLNIQDAVFEKKDETTIRVILPNPVMEYKVDDLLAQKADLETKIADVEAQKSNAVNNWDNEIAGYQIEIDKLNKIISECEKVEVKSEISLKTEDTLVPLKEEV